jgi:phenylpropionate dioxygenase-like ring-hydroxylating dioxygenase large terminal subunit
MIAPTALNDMGELVRDDRVHRLVYTGTEIFEEEMRRIFGRIWVFIGHESEVPQPGDYKTTTIGRQPILMSRHTDGKVYVMYNRCRHRGPIVCRQESGNSTQFRCIYHGWTYRSDGALVGVPFRSGYPPDLDFSDLGLMRLPRVESHRGFVFAGLSSDGQSLGEFLGPVGKYIDKIVDCAPEGEIEVRSGVLKYEYPANWKLQCENFMDHYHAPFTHESAFALRYWGQENKLEQQARDSIEIRAFSHGHSVMFHPAWTRERAELPEDYAAALERSRGKETMREILSGDVNLHVYPNLIFQEYSQAFRVIRPVAVDRTQVFVYPYRLKGAPQAFNDRKVRGVSRWASATGTGQPDDMETFVRAQEGLQAERPEWVILARGLHHETTGPDGERISGAGTDETALRGQYRYWKRLMSSVDSHGTKGARDDGR